MESTDTLRKLKEQAETNALKRLQSEFSLSDQLEQIEQHIIRNEKTKVKTSSLVFLSNLIKFKEYDRKPVKISHPVSFHKCQLLYGPAEGNK